MCPYVPAPLCCQSCTYTPTHLFCQEDDADQDDEGTCKGWVGALIISGGDDGTHDLPGHADVVQHEVVPAHTRAAGVCEP